MFLWGDKCWKTLFCHLADVRTPKVCCFALAFVAVVVVIIVLGVMYLFIDFPGLIL